MPNDAHRTIRERARQSGRLLEIDAPEQALTLDELGESTRGTVSEALEAERKAR